MSHRAEHLSSEPAERKSREHVEQARRSERKESKRPERRKQPIVEEPVTEAEAMSMLRRRLENEQGKKANAPEAEEYRKKATALSESFLATYGVYPSQIGSEDEAKRLWGSDVGFFRRVAMKLSGAENIEAGHAWRTWYETDQMMEAMKPFGSASTEQREEAQANLKVEEEKFMEFPGKNMLETASELVSPKLITDAAQAIKEKKKVVAETKKVEEQIEAESHRSKAARAAAMLLNRVGFIAQEQKGYEEFNLPAKAVEAMDIFELERQLHHFDERVGMDGLKSMETANQPHPSDSKEQQQHAKELQKNIKLIENAYDKQIDKFESEYKAYLETPAGMQEALVTALKRLEALRDESSNVSGPESVQSHGDSLTDAQRHLTDLESALSTVKERMNKEAGKDVFKTSSQGKLFLTLQDGIKDLYEEQQKRVRTGGRQNMKSRVGMYGNKPSMPTAGFVGGYGTAVESAPAERPVSATRGKKKEEVVAAEAAAVVEPEIPVELDLETDEELRKRVIENAQGLNEEQQASLVRYADATSMKDHARWEKLMNERITKLKKEPLRFKGGKTVLPALGSKKEQLPVPEAKPIAEVVFGKEQADYLRDTVRDRVTTFENMAAKTDDETLKTEAKEFRKLIGKGDATEEYVTLFAEATNDPDDKDTRKTLDRLNDLLNIESDALKRIVQPKPAKKRKAA